MKNAQKSDSREDREGEPRCVKCGATVEPARKCYAIPMCYACLPPPQPLPLLAIPSSEPMKLVPTPATREKCKHCGTDQEGICGFYYEDLCPDANPDDLRIARERAFEDGE